MPRAGIVTLAGRPNAGKSTLLNRLVGQKLAITSEKPQSTRNRFAGILSLESAQLVLLDTPGLLEPRDALHRAMRAAALQALRDADIILHIVDATTQSAHPIETLAEAAQLAHPPAAPVIRVLNKLDLVPDDMLRRLRETCPDAALISASTGSGVPELLDRIITLLPESPFLYDAEDISTAPLRHFAAEFVREAALEQLHEEVPHAVACVVEEYREDQEPVYIRAVLYVERASQKQILIGRAGTRIRAIGKAARQKIETLVGAPVYLDLWVKVLANWRRDTSALRRLGYEVPEESQS